MSNSRTLVHPQLEQSTDWARDVWDQAADAKVLSDPEGIVLAANLAYYDLYGYTPEQVIGHSFAIIFPENQRAWAMEQYRQVFTGDTVPPTFESIVQRADGSLRVVETRISFLTQDGVRTAMHSAIRDITKRKQAEQALQTAHTAAERAAERTTRLQALTAHLAGALTVERVADAVLEQVIPLLDASGATLYLLSTDETEYVIIGAVGVSPELWQPWRHFPAAAALPVADAVRQRQLLLFPTRDSVPEHYRPLLSAAAPSQAWAVVPFIGPNGAAGGLTLGFTVPQDFAEETQQLLWALARQCAQALERARLYVAAEEARAARRRIRQAIRAALSLMVHPQDTLRLIAEQSLSVLEAQTAILCLLTGDGEYLELIHQAGYPPGVLDLYHQIPLTADVPLAYVARTGEPYFVETRETWAARFPRLADLSMGDEALAVVPMDVEDRRLGVMSIGFAQAQVFSLEDRALLLDLGQQYAEALERSRRYAVDEQARSQLELRVQERTAELTAMNAALSQEIGQHQATQAQLAASLGQLRAFTARLADMREEERRRLSRDLHDQLGGALTGLKMDAARLRRQQAGGQGVEPHLIDTFTNTIDEMTGLVRRIATDLRPPVLDDLGLVAALEWELAEFQKRSGLACELNAPEELGVLPTNTAIAVFRVFQECLTNIARHAQASAVHVTVQAADGELRMTIHDNGRGIGTAELRGPAGLGLVGMRERLHQVGGEFSISGESGAGTTVRVRVPLADSSS